MPCRDVKKQHLPTVDRTSDLTPPIVVAVVGPPRVGKTTLIKWVVFQTRAKRLLRSLVKRYTRQTLNNIKGPVTVVSGI